MTTMISECRWELVGAYIVVCEGRWVSVGVGGSDVGGSVNVGRCQ